MKEHYLMQHQYANEYDKIGEQTIDLLISIRTP